LRALYIQENMFDKIENLNHLKDLHYLNLNDNYIKTIENLSDMPNLGTLQIKKNKIGKNGLSDWMGLLDLQTITVLDISENLIDDPAFVEEILIKMENLAVLYLKGNPMCKKIKNYKKTIISKMPKLRYLDDSPVFPEDRRYAEAFTEGGLQKEREERKKVKKEKDDEHWKNHEAFRDMIRKAKERKQKQEEEKGIEAESQESEQVIETDLTQQQLDKQKMQARQEPNVEEIEDDMPPALEEVSPEELAKETQNKKVQDLIDTLAAKEPQIENGTPSKTSEKSVVDVEDVKINNSDSINLSVTSETSEVQRTQTEGSTDQIEPTKTEESEEEKHLDDSTSEVEDDSIKTAPGMEQEKLNDSHSSQQNLTNAKQNSNDEDGEYLDELD